MKNVFAWKQSKISKTQQFFSLGFWWKCLSQHCNVFCRQVVIDLHKETSEAFSQFEISSPQAKGRCCLLFFYKSIHNCFAVLPASAWKLIFWSLSCFCLSRISGFTGILHLSLNALDHYLLVAQANLIPLTGDNLMNFSYKDLGLKLASWSYLWRWFFYTCRRVFLVIETLIQHCWSLALSYYRGANLMAIESGLVARFWKLLIHLRFQARMFWLSVGMQG